jgi:osomolarity two-component system sensor histidine kinase SLN1
VELSLGKHESHSSLLTRTIGDLFPPAQHGPRSPTQTVDEDEGPQRPVLNEEDSRETARPPHVQRPTYLLLPSPPSFSYDENPLSASTSPAQSASSTGEGAAFDRGLHVLVVDDDGWTRTLMKRMLTRLGCKVSTAENGEVALEMILGASDFTPSSEASSPPAPTVDQGGYISQQVQESRYSVVFLDNQMPVMSGIKAVAKLRELGRRDFIVGVTGNALLSDQEEYLAAGADQ